MLRILVFMSLIAFLEQSCNKCVNCTTVTKTISLDTSLNISTMDRKEYKYCGSAKEIKEQSKSYSLIDSSGNIKLRRNITTACE
jgi:hypothetical protein